jgi:flagellar M-ring protein FliF
MDFFSKAYQPIRDLFASMSIGARITAGLLLAAIVVGLAFLVTRGASEADEYLLSGQPFSESELARMEGAFAKANLGGYQIVGNRVRIPQGQKAAYVAALVDGEALPPNPSTFMDVATNDANPFESKQQREARLKHAREKQLSHVISHMTGVRTATVAYDEQEKGGFPRRVEKTAVAAVWPEGPGLTEKQIRSIRDYVAGSIAGLGRDNVTVIDQSLGVSYSGGEGGFFPTADDAYAARKRGYEEEWREKILANLSMVPGVVVGVNVELDSELIDQRMSVEFDPKKTAAVATKESRKTENSTGPAPGGRPGAVPNGVTANAGAAVAQVESPKSESEVSDAEQINNVSRNETRGSKAAYVPKVVKASIRVPQSYFTEVWQRANPPAAGEPAAVPTAGQLQDVESKTKQSIESAVVALLLEQEAGADPYTAVTVTTYQDLKAPEPEAPTITAQTTTWLGGNWQTLSMVLLGLVSLVMLRGVVRSGPARAAEGSAPEDDEGPLPAARVAAPIEEEPEETEAQRRLKGRFRISGPNLKAELAEMVREDPESAAKVLSKWIGEMN